MKYFDKKLLANLIALIWLMVISLAYVVTHKAFSSEILVGILGSLWRITLAIIIVSIAAGLGQKIISKRLPTTPILSIAAGLGTLSIGTLLIGVSLGISITVIGLLLLAIWVRREILGFWQGFLSETKILSPTQAGAKACAILCGILVLLNLPIALAPPLEFDALTYHLVLPQHYIQAGRIVYVPEIMFWGMPQLTEMLYTLAMLFGGNAAPAAMGWLIGTITLIGVGNHASQKFSPIAGWIAIASLLSGHTLCVTLSWAYVEWVLILYGLAWLITLEKVFSEKSNRGWLILIGVFSGMALSVKYTAGLLSMLAMVVLFFRQQKASEFLRDMLTVGLVLTLVSLPWWVKNLAWTGNPFYPLLFPSTDMDILRLDFYQNIPARTALFDSLTLPWYITIWGVEGKIGPSASIGPLLLGFSALAWIGYQNRPIEQRNTIKISAITLLAGFVFWSFASQRNALLIQPRLFMSIFPAWAILAAAGYETLSTLKTGTIRFGRIALAIAIMFVGFSLIESFSATLPKRAVETNLGLISENAYLEKNLGNLQTIYQALRELPQDSRILMLWETRSFYCGPICDPDEIIDRWYHDSRMYGNAQSILTEWKAENYTHMLISDAGSDFVRKFDNAKFNEKDWQTLDELREILGTGQKIGIYTLYELK